MHKERSRKEYLDPCPAKLGVPSEREKGGMHTCVCVCACVHATPEIFMGSVCNATESHGGCYK